MTTTDATTDRLEDGWSDATPSEDTVLVRAVRALAESTAVPAAHLGGRALRSPDLVATDLGRPSGFWNSATVLRPRHTTEAWTALIDRVEAFADHGGTHGDFDLWSPFQGPDLGDRGWQCTGHPPLMWRDPGGVPPPPPEATEVFRVTDDASVREWACVAAEAYPIEADPTDLAGPELVETDEVTLYGARLDGATVGVSMVVRAAGCNAIPLIAVDPSARGRGIGAALTWAATTHEPALPAVLYASDAGRPVYEHLGYRALLRATVWVRKRPDLRRSSSG